MAKPLIVANWKMNPASQKEAQELFDAVKHKVSRIKHVDVVVCPPFIFLSQLKGLTLGAQNVFYKEEGAFTGEVSPAMLKDLGVEYVIIGHSEAREFLHESNEVIAKKIKAALDEKLKVIFCIGEKKDEDRAVVLERQITEGLKGITNLKSHVKNISIAYEPIWAIGTGNNCSVDETMSSIMLIRRILTDMAGREAADATRILYGGSVKPENAASYTKEAGANGLLVGGASLDAEEFVKIVKSVEV